MTTRPHLQYHTKVVPLLVERTSFKAQKAAAKKKGASWTYAAFKATAGFEPDDYETSAEVFCRDRITPSIFSLKSQEQKAYRVARHVVFAPNFISHESQRMFPMDNGIDPVTIPVFVVHLALFLFLATGSIPLPPSIFL